MDDTQNRQGPPLDKRLVFCSRMLLGAAVLYALMALAGVALSFLISVYALIGVPTAGMMAYLWLWLSRGVRKGELLGWALGALVFTLLGAVGQIIVFIVIAPGDLVIVAPIAMFAIFLAPTILIVAAYMARRRNHGHR